MEAWPHFKGTLVLYNLSAGDNSQAAKGAGGDCALLQGAWHHRHWGCQDLPCWGHGYVMGRTEGPPQWVPFCAVMFWGCPKAVVETVPACALLWGHQLGAPPAPAAPMHRDPKGYGTTRARAARGQLLGGSSAPGTHGLGAPPQPSMERGMGERGIRGGLVPWVQG